MMVCKYFMEGYCKFGTRCKFSHDLSYSYKGYNTHGAAAFSPSERPSGTSILKGDNVSFNSGQTFDQTFTVSPQQSNYPQNASFGMKSNVHDVMQIVSKDIILSERGNQWQLSAYSPIKEMPPIPGFEDHSPEELRWECYKSLQNGSLQLWQAIVQQLHANIAKVNNELKKKDTGYAIINSWLCSEEGKLQAQVASQFGTSNISFTGLTNTDTFYGHPDVQAANSGSIPFVHPQQQTVNSQQFQSRSSVFGGSQQTVQQQPVFTQNMHPFSSQPVSPSAVDNQAYSTIEDLTEQEIQVFKADRFSFGLIPTKPPPKALCNL